MAIIDKIQLSGTVYTIGNETTTAVTSASTDNEIPTAKAVYDAIPQGGGGKAIEAGRGISITTGETADTVSFNLPISAGTGNNAIIIGKKNNEATAFASFVGGKGGNGTAHSIASGEGSFAFGSQCSATSSNSIAMGGVCLSSGYGSFANGGTTTYGGGYVAALGASSHAEGNQTSATSYCSHSEGYEVLASNDFEHSQGRYNVSNKANGTWGDSGNTLFSVGNGTADNARHNAFEIRQNGDIYLTKDGQDVKLQDQLGGGGGSSYTAGDGIDITNDVISVTGKQDTLISGTNIKTINNESILGDGNITIQGGGGKAVSGGTNISITTGETADTINCTLNASNGSGAYSFREGWGTYANKRCAHAEGEQTIAGGNYSHAEGYLTMANDDFSHTEGYGTKANNKYEHSSGQYNVSNSGSTTFGNGGNTLFSVGNGTSNSARHNAFEIRQNGDIYITKDGQDVKLQDQLGGGGGSSYTAGDGIDITYDVISVTGKQDTLISGTNIKTINNESILGSGNITIGGGGSITIDPSLDSGSTNAVANSAITNAINSKMDEVNFASFYGNQYSAGLEGYYYDSQTETQTQKFDWGMVWQSDGSIGFDGDGNLAVFNKQDTLVSGTNIKTINNESILGSGNIDIQGGGGSSYSAGTGIDITNDVISVTGKQDTLISGTNIKTINNESILGSGNITIGGGGTIDQSVISGSTNAVSGGAVYTQLGGLKLQKITQSAYDALSPNYDANTLYVING